MEHEVLGVSIVCKMYLLPIVKTTIDVQIYHKNLGSFCLLFAFGGVARDVCVCVETGVADHDHGRQVDLR